MAGESGLGVTELAVMGANLVPTMRTRSTGNPTSDSRSTRYWASSPTASITYPTADSRGNLAMLRTDAGRAKLANVATRATNRRMVGLGASWYV
jgi:hypothetical protein